MISLNNHARAQAMATRCRFETISLGVGGLSNVVGAISHHRPPLPAAAELRGAPCGSEMIRCLALPSGAHRARRAHWIGLGTRINSRAVRSPINIHAYSLRGARAVNPLTPVFPPLRGLYQFTRGENGAQCSLADPRARLCWMGIIPGGNPHGLEEWNWH